MNSTLKKFGSLILLGFWFGFQGYLWSSVISNSDRKFVISILYFDDQTNDPELSWVKKGLPELLYTYLSQSRQLRLVERNRMKELVDEMTLKQAGFTEATALEVGHMLGAEYNIYGSVLKTSPDLVIVIGKIADINTSEVFTEQVEGEKVKLHSEIAKQLAGKLLNRLLQLDTTGEKQPDSNIKPEPSMASTKEVDLLPGYTQSLAATAHFYRALDFLDNQNWDLARQEYEQAIKLDPSFARAYINLGTVYHQLGDLKAAIQNIQQGLKIFPESDVGHFNLGLIYGHQDQLDLAITEFMTALTINPDNQEVYVELGKAYYLKEDYDRAIEAYKHALSLDNNFAPANYYLGLVYMQLKRPEDAMREWQQAILSQDNTFKDIRQKAFMKIGDLYFGNRRYELALSHYQKGLEITLENEITGELLLRCGKSYLQTDRPQLAISLLEQALNYIPKSPDLHLNYGSALLGIKENDRAIAEFQMTVKLDPEGKYGSKAKEFLKKLQGY